MPARHRPSTALIAAVLAIVVLGCERRQGLNMDCLWPAEQAVALDLADPRSFAHLLDDIRVAEELEIRHGDFMAGRRPVSVLGVMVRMGLGAPASSDDVRRVCLNSLMATIADTHGLSVDDVVNARLTLAESPFDPLVALVALLLFAWIGRRTAQWVARRFGSDERLARVVAVMALSIFVGVAVMAAASVGGALIEIIRVGNEHMSYRAGRPWWVHHTLLIAVLLVPTYWALAFVVTQRTDRRSAKSEGAY